MDNCIFCKIATKEAPADIVYEDERFLVFPDIHPIASLHLPKSIFTPLTTLHQRTTN
jgi:diadenosine tetraphosphate (Ap4A) HIT family hydrolase